MHRASSLYNEYISPVEDPEAVAGEADAGGLGTEVGVQVQSPWWGLGDKAAQNGGLGARHILII